MFSALSPTHLFRMASELALLAAALIYVIRIDRPAGLLLAAGASGSLVAMVCVPALQLGIAYFQFGGPVGNNSWMWVLGILVLDWLIPLFQSLELGLYLAALIRVCRRVPSEAREKPSGGGWRER